MSVYQVNKLLYLTDNDPSFRKRMMEDPEAVIKEFSLTPEERKRGVIAMSAGNHAQAVAYHARRLGIPATIVMPESAPLVKAENTRAYGARVILYGETLYESAHRVREIIEAEGLVLVHPYDDPKVMAGQGTIGMEMLADAPDLDQIIVPIGGVHRAVVEAMQYATIIGDDVRAVYVDVDPVVTEAVRRDWERWGHGVPLVVLDSPYRSLMEPLLDYIERVDVERPDDFVTILLPEFVPARWWHHLLHNQRALLIKAALLFKRNTIVTSVPFHLDA